MEQRAFNRDGNAALSLCLRNGFIRKTNTLRSMRQSKVLSDADRNESGALRRRSRFNPENIQALAPFFSFSA
jgi:hypothetical protein